MSTVTLKSRQLVVELDEEALGNLPFTEDTPLSVRVEDGQLVVGAQGRDMPDDKFRVSMERVFKKYDDAMRRLAE